MADIVRAGASWNSGNGGGVQRFTPMMIVRPVRFADATSRGPELASLMSREALHVLMRHQSEQTTARYINYAQQIKPAAQQLHVPDILRLPEPRAVAE